MLYRAGVKRVLMVQACHDDWTRLESGLVEAGYSLLDILPATARIEDRVKLLQPDMLVAEADEPRMQVLEQLAQVEHASGCPVVLFTRRGSDRMVMTAMQLGVVLHVVEALTPLLLHSLIEVAALYYLNQHLLQDELETLQNKLVEQRYIEQAKYFLMEEEGLSENEAYASLRSTAMHRSQRLVDVSRALLAARSK